MINLIALCFTLFLYTNYDFHFISCLGLGLSLRAILLLIVNFEKHIPVFELILALTYVQLVVSAFVTYQFNIEVSSDKFVMAIEELEYMSYVIPSLIITEIILTWPSKAIALQRAAFNTIYSDKRYQNIGLALFVSSLIIAPFEWYFSNAFAFIFYLVGILKYIGFFYLWVAEYRYRILILFLLLIYMTITTLRESIFINYLVWLIYIFSIILHGKRIPIAYKIGVLSISVLLLLVIQVAKMEYRQAVWAEGKTGGAMTFINIASTASKNEEFIAYAVSKMIVRLNQGYILAKVIEHNPQERDQQPGNQFWKEVGGIFMPRFLFPNKIEVNTGEKITAFTGWRMTGSYTMSVGVHGDGYGNFGYWGGLLFVGCFFFFTKWAFNVLHYASISYPSLVLWIPYLFFYSIRPGAEFYIITNWVIKSAIILIVIIFAYKADLRRPIQIMRKIQRPKIAVN